jgi:hypothetical protein
MDLEGKTLETGENQYLEQPVSGGANKGFLLSFVFVLGIGAIQYGYSVGVYNTMQIDF